MIFEQIVSWLDRGQKAEVVGNTRPPSSKTLAFSAPRLLFIAASAQAGRPQGACDKYRRIVLLFYYERVVNDGSLNRESYLTSVLIVTEAGSPAPDVIWYQI